MMNYDTIIARMQTADTVCKTKYEEESKVILQPIVSFDGHQIQPMFSLNKRRQQMTTCAQSCSECVLFLLYIIVCCDGVAV